MKKAADILKNPGLRGSFHNGHMIVRGAFKNGRKFAAIAGWNEDGWEHVSITLTDVERCPKWDEMAYIKDLFWNEDELVVQLHPPKDQYVNLHPHCLHLWRPVEGDFVLLNDMEMQY